MPIIAYKTMTLSVHYVQAHRIVCALCRNPFNFLIKEQQDISTTGIPLLSADESMRKTIMGQAKNRMKVVAQKERRGEAMCPHCKCYQEWMVRRSTWSGIGCGLLIGAVLMAIVVPLLGWALGMMTNIGIWLLAGVVVGAVGGIVLGKRSALQVGPHEDKEDARAMNDEDFTKFLTTCAEQDAEPMLTWFAVISEERPADKELWLTLGHKDFTADPIFPEEIDSDVIIEGWD